MSHASDLSHRLAGQAEAVCKSYLPFGRRQGRYWIVGDVRGAKGQSLYVKLFGEGAGRWRDAASAEHGDLLDLIRLNMNFSSFRETLAEARQFLRLPERSHPPLEDRNIPPPHDTCAAAEKLHSLSRPVPGTLAETYLRGRAITAPLYLPSLRFHPACYYRPDDAAPRQAWPALLGVVTGPGGNLTGLQRTYLARDGRGKAPFEEPWRAMGCLLGNAVRFGKPSGIIAAGEGIETVLSLLSLFPALPMAAGLTAAHLSAFVFPPQLRRFYMLRDNDDAGDFAEERLTGRCREARIEMRVLKPAGKDLNDDLRNEPVHVVKMRILAQMEPEDRSRFRA
jgi:Toprim domain